MKRQKTRALKDERSAVVKFQLAEARELLYAIDARAADRLLGKEKPSNSVECISGGRPESNRRKF
jgi:hypothetical protein